MTGAMVSPIFVGRESELAALTAALERAPPGGARAGWAGGEAGVGRRGWAGGGGAGGAAGGGGRLPGAGVVLVGGEAGVGKTRLVEEAGARGAAGGARMLTGACVELGGERLPLAPLVDALRMLARTTPDDELAGLLGPARSDLARLLPELD